MKRDVVYFVKDAPENEELRYSLRSIEKNMPGIGNVWFVGGCPDGLTPDKRLEYRQEADKHKNVKGMIRAAVREKEISEEFWLFNDDFFIFKKSAVKNYVVGTLWAKVDDLIRRYGIPTAYAERLKKTAIVLKGMGLDRLSYEGHTPMLIDKGKAEIVFQKFDDDLAFRSCYGNFWKEPAEVRQDVKILRVDVDVEKHPDLLSTMDETFADGRVGRYIRRAFPTPSRWEK